MPILPLQELKVILLAFDLNPFLATLYKSKCIEGKVGGEEVEGGAAQSANNALHHTTYNTSMHNLHRTAQPKIAIHTAQQSHNNQ